MKYSNIDNSKPLKLCFIGCGHITKSHANTAKKSEKSLEISFASRSLGKAETYKNKFKGIRSYGSYETAIKSQDEDVIMINTPPDSHFDLVEMALAHGKHVILEKPPFFRSSDFDVLGGQADHKGLQLLIAENYYYKPLRASLKKILDDQLIGRPLFAVINATKYQKSKNDWREDKSITGFGALFEGGIHWVNFLNNLGFEIVKWQGYIPGKVKDLERSIQATAVTNTNLVINLLYSWEVNTIFKGLRISRIYGTEGSITFESNGLFIWVRGRKKRLIFPGIKNISGSRPMFNDFMSALRNGEAPEFDWRMAKKDLSAIEKIYQSAHLK